MTLRIVPINFDEAKAFVAQHHRHHLPPLSHKFSLAVAEFNDSGEAEFPGVRGVAIIGRPVARRQQDGWTLEITRLATDGTRNACSMLYRAAWRVARELGYLRLITYTLPDEGGASLRAAAFKLIGERRGGSWNVPSRPRVDKHPMQRKFLWECVA